MSSSMRWKNRWTATSSTCCTASRRSSRRLKSGAMGARTIDEGAMDEKSGMNFSEYMALLSGNTDLLDKAKLEKRIASLEGERKSFNKGKRDSEFKLEAKTGELRNNTAVIEAMTEDCNRFLSVVKTDKEGNRLNAVKVDGVDSTDEKVIGKRLQEIAKNATTGGLYKPVGELYGFPIKVVSERILKEGLEFTDNRFVVEGNYKYTYNNGHLAMADPVAAARNFLNALEKIPSTIDQYKAKERGAGKGDSAVEGDSGQGMEEGGRTETVEVRTCRARPQDTVGACAAHARSRRKRKKKGWTGSQTGCGRCTEHIATTNR